MSYSFAIFVVCKSPPEKLIIFPCHRNCINWIGAQLNSWSIDVNILLRIYHCFMSNILYNSFHFGLSHFNRDFVLCWKLTNLFCLSTKSIYSQIKKKISLKNSNKSFYECRYFKYSALTKYFYNYDNFHHHPRQHLNLSFYIIKFIRFIQ